MLIRNLKSKHVLSTISWFEIQAIGLYQNILIIILSYFGIFVQYLVDGNLNDCVIFCTSDYKLYHPLIHAEFQYETGTPDYSGTSECNAIEYIKLIFPKCQNLFLPFLFNYFDSKRYAHHYTKEIMSRKKCIRGS